jgi:hypothetical protein
MRFTVHGSAPRVFDERERVDRTVVHAFEQDDFVGDLAPLVAEVAVCGGHDLAHRVGGRRHEPPTQVIVSRVQRHGQVVGGIRGRKSLHLARVARRADRDAPSTHVDAVRIVNALQRRQQRLEIQHGLTHAHDDEVRQPSWCR